MVFPVKVRAALVGLVVAGGAVAAAAVGPAGPAVGQSSPPIQLQIQVSSTGTLVAKGAGVDVAVTASCPAFNGATAVISVSLTEAVGKSLATGSGQVTINCTGTAQTISVRVLAGSGKSFRTGSAQANAFISACTFTCASQQVEPIIKISS